MFQARCLAVDPTRESRFWRQYCDQEFRVAESSQFGESTSVHMSQGDASSGAVWHDGRDEAGEEEMKAGQEEMRIAQAGLEQETEVGQEEMPSGQEEMRSGQERLTGKRVAIWTRRNEKPDTSTHRESS
ncbi:hypothetical protein AVEN_94762-1 [Araneus ventricosus]|uniref:Uncharacterized protein n=1 Tax=Araneus ventricosus TaxID=182803 RepID=A0A4Y2CP08_ARAVE|nr:hypothetical protein AVEN_94762-1 [Araneus ventricosus]